MGAPKQHTWAKELGRILREKGVNENDTTERSRHILSDWILNVFGGMPANLAPPPIHPWAQSLALFFHQEGIAHDNVGDEAKKSIRKWMHGVDESPLHTLPSELQRRITAGQDPVQALLSLANEKAAALAVNGPSGDTTVFHQPDSTRATTHTIPKPEFRDPANAIPYPGPGQGSIRAVAPLKNVAGTRVELPQR